MNAQHKKWLDEALAGNVNEAEVEVAEIVVTQRTPAMRTAGDEDVIDEIEPDVFDLPEPVEVVEVSEDDGESDDETA